jgi:hypothetical protein
MTNRFMQLSMFTEDTCVGARAQMAAAAIDQRPSLKRIRKYLSARRMHIANRKRDARCHAKGEDGAVCSIIKNRRFLTGLKNP